MPKRVPVEDGAARLLGGLKKQYVRDFLIESNRIEGIVGALGSGSVLRAVEFIERDDPITIPLLTAYVLSIQPDAVLRDRPGLDVIVGSHRPQPGSLMVRAQLQDLLEKMERVPEPCLDHVAYETLHPYTDGNGRSGRILWARQMVRMHGWKGLALRFLHRYYYQTLDVTRRLLEAQ